MDSFCSRLFRGCAALATDNAVLLVAAWCFSRSSPRFHRWLLYNSWFGGYLRHWQEHRGLPSGAKPKAIVFIILTFALSLWLVNLWWVRILLLVILTGLLFFMWRLPVIDAEQQKRRELNSSVAFFASFNRFERFRARVTSLSLVSISEFR